MLKQISRLGTALNKLEQKAINGGNKCGPTAWCPPGMCCSLDGPGCVPIESGDCF